MVTSGPPRFLTVELRLSGSPGRLCSVTVRSSGSPVYLRSWRASRVMDIGSSLCEEALFWMPAAGPEPGGRLPGFWGDA